MKKTQDRGIEMAFTQTTKILVVAGLIALSTFWPLYAQELSEPEKTELAAEETEQKAWIQTLDGAKSTIGICLESLGIKATVDQTSAFVRKIIANREYFIAKALVVFGDGSQSMIGVVLDFSGDSKPFYVLSEPNFRRFVKTGDKSILRTNLNPEN